MSSSAIIISNDADLNALDWAWAYFSRLLDTPGQITILLLLLAVFIWTILRTRKNRDLWEQVKAWSQSSIGALIIIVVFLYISPILMPDSDSFGLYRSMLLRTTSFLGGMVLVTASILFVSRTLFPDGGLFKQIMSTTYGSTIILSVIIASLCYLMTYS
jgi:hypothetical protein